MIFALPRQKISPTKNAPLARRIVSELIKPELTPAVLVLAGKGHEDYQVLGYGTIHFDEKEVVARLLTELQENRK